MGAVTVMAREARCIVREHGAAGLYYGFAPRFTKIVIGQAAAFGMYEYLQLKVKA